jgi:peptide/nickel transport system substrate-binding protein
MKKSLYSSLIALILIVVGLPMDGSGVARGSAPSANTPQEGGTLTAARAADALIWDPAVVNENDSLWAEQQIQATLVKITPDGKGFMPYIAQSWNVSDGGRLYTFHLFPQAKFCNGQPITSADVVYSFDRESASNSINAWQFPGLVSVTAQGPNTVLVRLKNPSPAYISYVTLWGSAITSKAYGEKVGAKGLADKPLGTGPFCLANWQKGQEIDLVRNQYYWLKDAQGNRLPYLDAINWKIIPDDNARVLALESGQVQVITAVPAGQFAQLKSIPHVVPGETYALATALINLVVHRPYFADLKVRQAMNYALDKNAIVKAVLFGHGQPAMSPYDLANWSTPTYGYTYNLAKAKQLMAQSTYPHGFTCTVIYVSGDTVAAETMVIVKAQLAKIGITMNIRPLESGAFTAAYSAETDDMWYGEGTGDIFDPSENLHFEMLPKSLNGSDASFTGWSDPTVSKLVLAAEQEMDVNKRIADYHEIERIYMTTGPGLWLFSRHQLWATRDNVHGFFVYPTVKNGYEYAWLSH